LLITASMRIKVLVADDHELVAEGLCHLIGREPDIEVVGRAASSQEALRAVAELHPEVVVMDVSMPDLDGIEAAAIVRKRWPGTQVVILTMHSEPHQVRRAQRAGALGYVLKRSASRDLVKAIRSAHAGLRWISERIDPVAVREAAPASAELDLLSMRERQVLQLLVQGRRYAEIAEMLSLSPKTVETYRGRILSKLGLKDLPSLVKFAIRHGLTSVG